jgi:hypothetical protein
MSVIVAQKWPSYAVGCVLSRTGSSEANVAFAMFSLIYVVN